MTLIYPTDGSTDWETSPDPVTHALVIGCGRFPHLSADKSKDRKATSAGAEAVVQFLHDYGQKFVAKVATIECVVSDPDLLPGEDHIELVRGSQDDGGTVDRIAVESAIFENVRRAAREWRDRCRPGDHMFFYMSSHGIADGTSAIGVCEDVNEIEEEAWTQSINVTTLAQGVLVNGAGRAWVFFDACQEVVQDLLGAPTGSPAFNLVRYSLADLTRLKQKPVALAGSRFGGKAWAPRDGAAPYFTQALLEGLKNACVEPVAGAGWVVTGAQILFGLKRVSEAVLDWPLETEPLHIFNEPQVALLTVPSPMVPVKVTTETEAHYLSVNAGTAVCSDPAIQPIPWQSAVPQTMAWRFRVPADRVHHYLATLQFNNPAVTYSAQQFYALPPAQVVVLKP